MPHNRKSARKTAKDSHGTHDHEHDSDVPEPADGDSPREDAETFPGNAGVEEELDRLRRERDEAHDKMLRALAELENYRNRVNRERSETLKYASIDLIRDLLPVWDNIARTLEAAEKTPNLEALVDGVRMIDQQFLAVLKQHHCIRIEAVGQPFDPNYHASVARMPSDEHEQDTVMYETQPGFVLYDRIVRPTQVVLAGS